MNLLNATTYVYPDAVKFLFWMLGVIALAIWVGMRGDRE